jgi:hypothetical protein
VPEPLHPDEVHTGEEYESVRADERQAVVESQRERRVHLGERLTLVFESRDTIRVSLEEMLRAERISDQSEVSARVDAFNEFVPQAGHLGATLYVAAAEPAELNTVLSDLEGVHRSLYLEIDGVRISGQALEDASADELAAASFITFAVPPEAREAWRRGGRVAVGVAHPNCSDRAELSEAQRAAIGADF